MNAAQRQFRSARLVYRAFQSPDDDGLFDSIQRDPVAFGNSCASLHKPLDSKFIENIRKYLMDNSLLFVVISLATPNLGEEVKSGEAGSIIPRSIGTLFLKASSPDMTHHSCSELGIDILHQYQAQGYGAEAITWALDWAFGSARLHRVELMVLGWNERVKALYERLGFKEEGRKRENLWRDGRWWDEIYMGLLEDEWREAREGEVAKSC
ncbi:hypothetical protein MBLNU459_g5106t1 [Dothideomycetes sp. NU459]